MPRRPSRKRRQYGANAFCDVARIDSRGVSISREKRSGDNSDTRTRPGGPGGDFACDANCTAASGETKTTSASMSRVAEAAWRRLRGARVPRDGSAGTPSPARRASCRRRRRRAATLRWRRAPACPADETAPSRAPRRRLPRARPRREAPPGTGRRADPGPARRDPATADRTRGTSRSRRTRSGPPPRATAGTALRTGNARAHPPVPSGSDTLGISVQPAAAKRSPPSESVAQARDAGGVLEDGVGGAALGIEVEREERQRHGDEKRDRAQAERRDRAPRAPGAPGPRRRTRRGSRSRARSGSGPARTA